MARKIIILRSSASSPGELAFGYALWADVPVARQSHYVNAQATTAVTDATGPELAAIQSGAIAERTGEARWPAGTTIAQVQAFLVSLFNVFQAEITAANPWQRTGTSWDGTTWTVTNNG